MKVVVLQDNFSKILSTATRFVSTRAQLPVLNNIKLVAKAAKLEIYATNLETSFYTSLGAKLEEEGEISVPAKTITDIINNLADNQVNLVAAKETLAITTENFKSTLAGINTSDFPDISVNAGKGAFSIDTQKLTDVLANVLFSVSSDETRPILTGVFIKFEQDTLVLVSTDGFRLTESKIEGVKAKAEDIIIPKSALSEVMKLFDSEESLEVNIDKENSQVIFEAGNTTLATRSLGSEFPDYKKRIPEKSSIEVKVDRESLQRAVRLGSVFARESSNIVRISVEKDSLELAAESSKSGTQENKVDAEVAGGEIEIAFNYKYLEEVLNVLDSEEVILEFNDTNSPMVVKSPKVKNFIHIIMPVKV